jgi:serine/threonine protein kinase
MTQGSVESLGLPESSGRFQPAHPQSPLQDITMKVKILIVTASVLVFMHDRNIRHGNLNPGDILLDESGDLKIKVFRAERVMSSAVILGSESQWNYQIYAAPEGARLYHVGVQADVYSFGLIMLGVVPGFRWVYRSFSDHHRHCLGRPMESTERLLQFIGHYAPPSILKLATSCLAFEPNDRPTSREVLQTLCSQEFLESIPGLDFAILKDVASQTVPPELRGFLA